MTLDAAALPVRAAEGMVPIAAWGKDHWSTLAYVDSVMVDVAGFQVGLDARMKSNRRNFRVMGQQCPRPKRANPAPPSAAQPMHAEHATRLRDGTAVAEHDDWCCVQDFAAAGLFTVGPEAVKPGEVLHWSDQGRALVNALRAHKAGGGQFAAFRPG